MEGQECTASWARNDAHLHPRPCCALGPPLPAQVKGAEKVLYGLDDVVGSSDIIIVEGEMDKLALEEAGFRNVVSVSARGWLGDCVVPSAAQQGKAGP